MKKIKLKGVIIFSAIMISIVLFLHQYVYATVQVADKLLYDGKEYDVHGFKLTDEMNARRMTFLKETGNAEHSCSTSANWDGIEVNLSIKDNKLYITKIDLDNWELLGKPSCQEVFGTSIPKKGLFANWFSGELRPTFYPWDANEPSSTFFYFKNGVLVEIKKGLKEK